MPEANGHQDNPSRLDRMESRVQHIIDNHVVLEDKMARTDDQLNRLSEKVDKLSDSVAALYGTAVLQASTMDRLRLVETDGKVNRLASETDARLDRLGADTDARLNGLAALIEDDHRSFHERLNRLEAQ